MSFAQFEREIISERTRDKIAATRRKGKWSGGLPILGYDVDAQTTKLVVNEQEAIKVRAIFELYLRYGVLHGVVEELDRRGWRNKRWLTRKGQVRGGRPFTTTSLHKLLTNVAYSGQVKYKSEVHQGEHPAIVEEALWQQVQTELRCHGQTKGALVRNRFGALLKGLLYCVPCGCRMTPTHALNHGRKRYRYYVCTNGLKGGVCRHKSVAASALEQVVLEQLRGSEENPLECFQNWDACPPPEQARLVRLLVKRVDYDGTAGTLTIAFHEDGRQRLLQEQEESHDDA